MLIQNHAVWNASRIISYRPGIHCQGQTNIDQKLSYYAHFDHKLDIVVQNWPFFDKLSDILTVDKCPNCISVSYKNIWIVHPIKNSNRFCLALRFQPNQQQFSRIPKRYVMNLLTWDRNILKLLIEQNRETSSRT